LLSAYLCDSCETFIKDFLGDILGGANTLDFCGEGSAYFFDADVLELRLLNEAKHCGVSAGNKSQIKKLYQTVNK
jgi:hypothetical protein